MPSYSKTENPWAFSGPGAINDQRGMPLRDYFAAQAIVGMARMSETNRSSSDIAKWAYELADAMLWERHVNKGKQEEE